MLKWNLRKRKADELPSLDFSSLGTDIHSHLIPGIDDGPADMQTAVSLVKEMQTLGFKKLITTPHVMSDFYKNSSETILQGLSAVRSELEAQGIDMQIDAAAEYYVDYTFEQKIGKESFLVFGDKYILIELSFIEAPKSLYDIIFKLQLEGYRIVLAHPERYNYFDIPDYEDLIRRGVLFQLNFLSLIDYYSPHIRRKSEKLISKGMVSFMGSDCHNMKHASLYKRCQNQKYWHDISASGKLLNSTL